MAPTPLDVFLLLRGELDKLAELTQLLDETCKLSGPLDRKIPHDPFTCLPMRRDLVSELRTHRVCFERADFDRLSQSIERARELLYAFDHYDVYFGQGPASG